MCGHFPEGVQVFERRSIKDETRGQWYLRQMMGSANVSGSRTMHFMTGNLSHQIEHHLFPDLPSKHRTVRVSDARGRHVAARAAGQLLEVLRDARRSARHRAARTDPVGR
jgi:fatty acid desaturase